MRYHTTHFLSMKKAYILLSLLLTQTFICVSQSEKASRIYQKAGDLFFEQKYSDALNLYVQVLNEYSQYYDVYYKMGICKYYLANYSEAITDFQRYAGHSKLNLEEVYNYIGVSYMGLGKYEEAITEFDKAISAKRKYFLPYYNKGVCYYNFKNYKKAEKNFDKALKYNSQDYESLLYKGIIAYEHKEYKQALHFYNMIININSKYDLVYFNLGHTYYMLGDVTSSCKYYKKAEELGYKRAEIYIERTCK